MTTGKANGTDETKRRPGQRPEMREREELLLLVERALIHGATTPAEALEAVPDLGTWDTAKAYVAEVRARWAEAVMRNEMKAIRGEMVATIRRARQRAMAMLEKAESPYEAARLMREIDRLIDRETWLLSLSPYRLQPEYDAEEEEQALVEEDEDPRESTYWRDVGLLIESLDVYDEDRDWMEVLKALDERSRRRAREWDAERAGRCAADASEGAAAAPPENPSPARTAPGEGVATTV